MDRRRLRSLGVTTAVLAVVTMAAVIDRYYNFDPPDPDGTHIEALGVYYWVIVGLMALVAAVLLLSVLRSGADVSDYGRFYAVGAGAGAVALGFGLLSGLVIVLGPASGSLLELVQSATAVLSLPAMIVSLTATLFGAIVHGATAVATRLG